MLLILATLLLANTPDQYLSFQIFTSSHDTPTLQQNFPPLTGKLADQLETMVRAIGTVGTKTRHLGFVVGPLSFDETDEQVRSMMRESFTLALQKNIATGFHIDDSMFWGRLAALNKPANIEWLDWNKTPSTGRRLDWSSVPTKIMPQLCLNSPEVEDAVKTRAALVGQEAVRGMKILGDHGHPELFLGVFAGWETQIGRDFDTGKYLGFHALANKGYTVNNPLPDLDQGRVEIVTDFVDLWATSLAKAGIPDEKIYSHTACMSRAGYDATKFVQPARFSDPYLEIVNFTPPSASFGPHHRPGFSTYPQFGQVEQIQGELILNGDPAWASAEGTAVDPAAAEKGDPGGSMETYLGNLFNRGAAVVNVFGWGVGPSTNPFRTVAESKAAIAAYQKFLHGETLQSDPSAQLPSPNFFDKLRKLKIELPPYLAKYGPQKVEPYVDELGRDLKAQRYLDAERIIDQLFQTITD